ncbi:hypothetical protein N7539_001810 [Penicillium diatomitis]|uniref:Uncharacterized protein n=1 Tax=Penicillium diatomitis TaxID=2819901 RepID=A0A9W9XHN2_9EURO|nr:uncharacterized protein N7539_001810 [Penicillium diatomitis]KAJ5493064.1 hypothetical protein N7539_001810 [Penicillium diatomitis]
MKFTGVAVSLALTGMASAAALPPMIPGTGSLTGSLYSLGSGAGGLQGASAAEGVLGGIGKREPGTAGLPGAESLIGGLGGLGGAGGGLQGANGLIGGLGRPSTGGLNDRASDTSDVVGEASNKSRGEKGQGAIGGTPIPGLPKRQLAAAQPVTNGAGSSLNGATGTAGSAVGTGESTGQGAAGTAEQMVANAGHLKPRSDVLGLLGTKSLGGAGDVIGGLTKGFTGGSGITERQLDAMSPVTEAVGSSMNGVTGTGGSAVGTAESTGASVVGTAESSVSGSGRVVKRQFGNLPATTSQTGSDLMAGVSGNPSGMYGALNNLRTVINAGQITPSDISNMPEAVQRVIANLAVA